MFIRSMHTFWLIFLWNATTVLSSVNWKPMWLITGTTVRDANPCLLFRSEIDPWCWFDATVSYLKRGNTGRDTLNKWMNLLQMRQIPTCHMMHAVVIEGVGNSGNKYSELAAPISGTGPAGWVGWLLIRD